MSSLVLLALSVAVGVPASLAMLLSPIALAIPASLLALAAIRSRERADFPED